MNKNYLIRVMRLLILFFLAGLLHVSAATNAQTITLKGNRLSFEKVLQAIRDQTGYTVFTTKQVIKNTRPISVDAKKMPIEQFLTLVIAEQPLEATVESKTIVIKKKDKAHVSQKEKLNAHEPFQQ